MSLVVYDHVGRMVETLVDDVLDVGNHDAVFRAQALARGIDLARLRAQPIDRKSRPIIMSRKMSLLR